MPNLKELTAGLFAVFVVLQLLAAVLPRVLPSLIVLAAVVALLRLVWFYTGHH